MTSSEAIPLLRSLISQIPGLRHRPAYNAHYRAWEKETVRVLAEGFDLSYLTRFERFKPHRVRNVDNFEAYLKDLDRKQRLLEEIVATHKSLLCGGPGAEAEEAQTTPLRPEDLTELGVEPEEVAIKIQPAEPRPSRSQPEARTEKPRVEKPRVEQPRAEKPRVEQPRAEEPRAEEPRQAARPTKQPAPAEEALLGAEKRLQDKIKEKEQLLAETEQAIADYRRQLEALGRLKGVLAAEGEKLQGLVKEALSPLGLEVSTKEGCLFVKENGHLIPLEIESAKGEVPERALRRLISRLPDEPPKDLAARGLLLGSAHLDTPLQERLETDLPFFGDNLKEQARTFGICLLSLKDVFMVLTGQSEEARAEFKSAVLSTTGLYCPPEQKKEGANIGVAA